MDGCAIARPVAGCLWLPMHALNLALRFLLEIAALWGFALWFAQFGSGWTKFAIAAAGVIALAAVWSVFAVPDDPSRSGNAPIPVPGTVRLVLELAILFGGAAAFWLVGRDTVAIVVALLIILHYAAWPARIAWLLSS